MITFNNSNVLGSANIANIPTTFENGWLDIGFHPDTVSGGEHILPTSSRRLPRWAGAPVPSSATYSACRWLALRFSRSPTARSPSTARSTLSNYGGSFVHKGTRRICDPLSLDPACSAL